MGNILIIMESNSNIKKKLICYKFPFNEELNWKNKKIKLEKLIEFIDNNSEDNQGIIKEICKVIFEILIMSNENSYGNSYPQLLYNYLAESEKKDDIDFFIKKVIPFMARNALEIENLFNDKEYYILTQDTTNELNLTKLQCLSILSNLFFCTLIKQTESRFLKHIYTIKGWVSFGKIDNRMEKLKCFLNYFNFYFNNLNNTDKDALVNIKRIVSYPTLDYEAWKNDTNSVLNEILIEKEKSIFDYQDNKYVQVDFANKYIGGGVLNSGCVQEEIMFTIMPECIISMLFSEFMKDYEAILISNVGKYADFIGYDSSFKFVKNDNLQIYETNVLAIDALHYDKRNSYEEKSLKCVLRELNKAYIGFDIKFDYTIVTGKWGCGVFNGNAKLKFILQWLAASRAKKNLIFCTFGDCNFYLSDKIIAKYKNKSTEELFSKMDEWTKLEKCDLFEYLLSD